MIYLRKSIKRLKMSKALYPGSFDMFTFGHLSVLEQAAKIFDEVIVCISQNPAKKRRFTLESSVKAIEAAITNRPTLGNIKVVISDSIIPAEIAKEYNCDFIIRGIRNTQDYLYEDQLAAFNNAFDPSIKTIYFRATDSDISSTMVRTFMKVQPVKAQMYLPYNISILKAL
jgi:pantetheine-phosphate adenylyltransferase